MSQNICLSPAPHMRISDWAGCCWDNFNKPRAGRSVGKLSEEQEEQLNKLREEGLSYKKIAVATGIDVSWVQRYFKRQKEGKK